jgi:hypothetical protein
MAARLPGGQTCQDGNFSKNGDFAQESHPPRWAMLQLWANLPRTAMWQKKATDDATYFNALQMVS